VEALVYTHPAFVNFPSGYAIGGRIDCGRFEKIGKNGEVLDPGVSWTWNRRGHYDSHIPEVFPYVTVSTQSVGERSQFTRAARNRHSALTGT
jgi:hypothetical protein